MRLMMLFHFGLIATSLAGCKLTHSGSGSSQLGTIAIDNQSPCNVNYNFAHETTAQTGNAVQQKVTDVPVIPGTYGATLTVQPPI